MCLLLQKPLKQGVLHSAAAYEENNHTDTSGNLSIKYVPL